MKGMMITFDAVELAVIARCGKQMRLTESAGK
jgi:hypothetical protein